MFLLKDLSNWTQRDFGNEPGRKPQGMVHRGRSHSLLTRKMLSPTHSLPRCPGTCQLFQEEIDSGTLPKVQCVWEEEQLQLLLGC